MTAFSLDPVLAGDTHPVTELGLCRVLLMNDARFAWLILVPQRAGVSEVFELTPLDQTMLTFETVTVSEQLKAFTGCDKINVAALGNQVSQLHVHVIARRKDDAAWPNPVWGSGPAVPYTSEAAQDFIAKFAAHFD